MTRKISGDAPQTKLPAGSTASHIHIYHRDFPSQPGGPDCPSDFASVKEYREVQKWLGLERVIVTNSNAHQTNNDSLLYALSQFGDSSRGIACIRPDTAEKTLESYHNSGVRGARIMNLGGATRLKDMLAVNQLIQPLDWSLIVQFDGNQLAEHTPLLNQIQGNYVFDHHGKFFESISVDGPELKQVLKMIDKGNCYFKLAACYESSTAGYPNYTDVADIAKVIIKHAPERVLWGSNWPHVSSSSPDNTPCDATLLDTVCSWIPNQKVLEQIFVENPARLYGFDK